MKRQRQSEGTWSLKKPRNVNDGQKESDVAVDETDILRWWSEHEKVFPILARMARDKLAIQTTSVPVERFFSKAGLIDQPKRRSLGDDSFRGLLKINAWSKSELRGDICGFDNFI